LAPSFTKLLLLERGTPTVTLVEEARLDRLVALYAASIAFAPIPS